MEKRSGDNKANVVDTPTKKARTAAALRRAAPAVPKKDPETGHGAEEPKTLDVTLHAPFEAAVFQCKNGHAACRGCCERVKGTCPPCGDPIGAIRCRPLEAAIAAMRVPCGFASAGCKEKVPYTNTGKRGHDNNHEAAYCHHAPCACPVPACAYSGSALLLHDHIRDAHRVGGDDAGAAVRFFREATVTLFRSMAFRVLLHAPDARVFLLLNGGDVVVPSASGRSLALISVGPRPAPDRALEYTMVVRAADAEAGELSLSASGPVPCVRRWAGPDHPPPDGFLFVPDAYWGSSGTVSVTVQVKKKLVVPPPPAPVVVDRP